MSTINLPLHKVRLSCPKEKLRLFITPSLQLHCPLDHLQPSDIKQALRSGCLWLSRGVACQMNLRLSLNGTSLDEDTVERLASLIRDADLWNQLSLSTSLEMPGHEDSDIRIRISHVQPSTDLRHSATSMSAIPGDTKPPCGVHCVALNSLELTLEFCTIRTASGGRRRKKPRLNDESMLLDHADFVDENEFEPLQGLQIEAVHVLQPASSHIYFDMGKEDGDALLLDTDPVQLLTPPSSAPKSDENGFEPLQGLQTEAVHVLHPASSQIYFDMETEDEDALLLDIDPVQLLTPPSSAPQCSLQATLKRLAQSPDVIECADASSPIQLDLAVASKLTDVGLRTLIGGRQIKVTPGVNLLKPDQEHTLSDLAPALWSPGYLKAVSQRSRFLPTLSKTLSTSLLRHVQSPSLQKMLFDLGDLQASPLVAANNKILRDDDGRPGSLSHKVAGVVQARVWKMTQKSLFDPLAARRLQRMGTPPAGARSRGDVGYLLADEIDAVGSTVFSSLIDDLAEFMDEEQFEDFLEDEEDCTGQDDLLADFAENVEDLQGFQNSKNRWNSKGVMGEVEFDELEIPEEFWEDLRLEEEGIGLEDELFIPEEFWEDLRMEEDQDGILGGEKSIMLI